MPYTSSPWAWAHYEAPVGPLLLAATAGGLVQVVFHADAGTTERAVERLGTHFTHGPGADADCRFHLGETVRQLDAYFAGAFAGPGSSFTVPLDWSLTGGFTRRALRELAAGVPYGSTIGYQDLAVRTGEAGAARAVGAAMGANPLPVIVPCHRVVASGGGIGGFSGGLETKRTLLALEGVLPEPLF